MFKDMALRVWWLGLIELCDLQQSIVTLFEYNLLSVIFYTNSSCIDDQAVWPLRCTFINNLLHQDRNSIEFLLEFFYYSCVYLTGAID